MSSSQSCASLTTLIAYWLGELDASEENSLEEHLFACEKCSASAGKLIELGRGIKCSMRAGLVNTVLTPAFVEELRESGVRVRDYRLQPGGSANCTITPEDDLVAAHLHAPFRGVERLDLMLHDDAAGTKVRIENVTFVPGVEEIVLVPDVTVLRRVSFVQRAELVAVEGTRERTLASYTFNHEPHPTTPRGL